jgi:hypothetical protein
VGLGFDKQPASRPVVYQNITWLTTGGAPGPKVCSAPFGVATQHIRVFSSISGWMSIDQSTSTTQATTGTIPSGVFIPASTTTGEYFTVTPGQLLTFFSTGTTTGYVSITEMG